MGVPATAGAYDASVTHAWLTRASIDHLAATDPATYAELVAHTEDVVAGAVEEDHPYVDGDTDPTTFRVMRHFFRPTDASGFVYGERVFPSSLEWSSVPREDNAWGWDDGLAHYQAGRAAEAYRVLGHVVHLVQDLTVPAHTQLVNHGPPAGDSFEKYCTESLHDDPLTGLPIPTRDQVLPTATSLHALWFDVAHQSYDRAGPPAVIAADMVPLAVIAGAEVMRLYVAQVRVLEATPAAPTKVAADAEAAESSGCSIRAATGATAGPVLLALLALVSLRRPWRRFP